MPKRGGRSSAAAVVRPTVPTLEDAVAQISSIKLLQFSLTRKVDELKEENKELRKRLEQAEQEAVGQRGAIEQSTQVVAASNKVVLEVMPQMAQDKGKPSNDVPADESVAGTTPVAEASSSNEMAVAEPAVAAVPTDAVVVVASAEGEEQKVKSGCKPIPFNNNEEDFVKWSRETMNYMNSVREGLNTVLSSVIDVENVLDLCKGNTEVVVVKHSQEFTMSVAVSELEKMNEQVYYLLIDLTEGESLDMVMSAGEGQGLEAWRKLNRHWDPSATGGVEMLWESIFRPKKSRIGDLKASIERLEDIMRRYLAKRPTKGKFVLSEFSEETKIASLLKLLPEGLEQYVQPNKLRLSSYSLLRTEAIQCAEELMAMEEYGRREKGKGKGKDPKGKGKGDDSKGKE